MKKYEYVEINYNAKRGCIPLYWLCWVQSMNSIRSRAEEIILAELVYR